MMYQLKTTLSVFSLFVLVLFTSCDKEGRARMQVYLTDDPGDYEAVFIDVKDIMVNTSSDSSKGWESLSNVARGTYDLLKLVNDEDTLLADASIRTGRLQQIRLVLGENNYVVVDGVRHKLETPSSQQSGLKINIHQSVTEGVTYKMLMDFDVAKSIVESPNGKYILKPVIRAMLQEVGGSIKGFVLPNAFQTAVLALQGTDTVASTYTENGAFWLKGMNAGTYDLHFLPSDPAYAKFTKTGISVATNGLTVVDTVRLQ